MYKNYGFRPYLLLALIILGPVNNVLADIGYVEARRLREAGKILPLETILRKLEQIQPGRIIEVELEKEDEHFVYEIELLGKDGIIREAEIDASSGEILRIKEDD